MSSPSPPTGVPDAVLLPSATLETFVENLHVRFDASCIYTTIGPVVISLNPYGDIPDLYSRANLTGYFGRASSRSRAPHIYALANDAYRGMVETGKSQTIIISGESGAGKTEASKIVMQFVAAVSGTRAADVEAVKASLLGSNPILEAFGNAQTIRNDNSSRFGKYMEIQFDVTGAPVGGKISQYLLEKSRVVRPGLGERAFHVFYFLAAGAKSDSALAERIRISGPDDLTRFPTLARSETFSVPTIDDGEAFAELEAAMATLGFAPDLVQELYAVLSGILHLSLVSFVAAAGSRNEVSAIAGDGAEVEVVASLLGVPVKDLVKALTSYTITTRGESISVKLDPAGAAYARDAFASALYNALFARVVAEINRSISASVPVASSIGVLDIYGFEILEYNTFEQFCINYTNEKLQKLFIDLTLEAEQAEYAAEGIKWVPIDYFDNGEICSLIDARSGIFAVLDEDTVLPNTTDESFLAKLCRTPVGSSPYFGSNATDRSLKLERDEFHIKHYAGDVVYAAESFLEKNKTKTYPDFAAALSASSLSLCLSLAPDLDPEVAAAAQDAAAAARASKAGRSLARRKKATTTVSVFKRQLADLLDTLRNSVPHYIRCIKPNDDKAPGVFDVERVTHQVQYLGLMENVRVARAGFCYRETYPDFVARYKMVSPLTWPNHGERSLQSACGDIMGALGVEEGPEYQLGKTKLFVKNPSTVFALEDAREAELSRIATLIQSGWRGYVTRREGRAARGAVRIQTAWRRYAARKGYVEGRAVDVIVRAWRRYTLFAWLERGMAAKRIQTAWRSAIARSSFRETQSAILLQSYVRRALSRSSWKVLKASTTIGSVQKGRYVRVHIEEIKEEAREAKREYAMEAAAVTVQSAFRGYQERKKVEAERAALAIQTAFRGHMRRRAYLSRRAEAMIRSWLLTSVLARRLAKARAVSHIAAVWRGKTARKIYERMISAVHIQRWIRAVWGDRMMSGVVDALDSGSPTEWPAPVVPSSEQGAARDLLLYKYRVWRAVQYRATTPESKRIAMWSKVRASELFRDAKPTVYAASIPVPFTGDALGLGDSKSKAKRAFDKIKASVGDSSSIVFSAPIKKLNRSFKLDSNAVVVTRSFLYRLKDKSYKLKTATPLDRVASISCSPYGDSFVVVRFDHVDHHDLVFSTDRVIEFCVRMIEVLDASSAAVAGNASSSIVAASMLRTSSGAVSSRVEFGEELVFMEPKGEYRLEFEPSLPRGGGGRVEKVRGSKVSARVVCER